MASPTDRRNAPILDAGRGPSRSLRSDSVGPIGVGADIAISIRRTEEQPRAATAPPVTRLELEWEAAERPGLFPLMKPELAVYPLTSTETQLDLSGGYEPPFEWVGAALDAVVGRRIAEASVHRFLSDVASYLRRTLD